MPKLRKQRRKKVYRHNVNRKRMRNKIFSVGKIECKELKDNWDRHKSIKTNLQEMGLAYDPNQAIKIPNTKQKLKTKFVTKDSDTISQEDDLEEEEVQRTKHHVAEELERNAKAPRKKCLRLPKSQVKWITYLMDKYESNYKAMARDKRNHEQETWKQLRAKIKLFKSIPEQFSEYLRKKGLTEEDVIIEEVVESDENEVF